MPYYLIGAAHRIVSRLAHQTKSLGKQGHWEGIIMRKWKSPKVVEIAVGMEINSYACARL
jgi:coenzyme PQQ precursor peptide PqqA